MALSYTHDQGHNVKINACTPHNNNNDDKSKKPNQGEGGKGR